MAESGPSQADRELAAALTRRGIKTSPWQVRRWRQAGLVTPKKRGLGRGQGTVALYSRESEEQAASLAEALKTYGRLDDAALVLFFRRFPIKERAVKRAYKNAFARLRKAVPPTSDEDPWVTADRAASAFSRRSATSQTATEWRRRLTEAGQGEDFPLVLQDLIKFFFLGAAEEDDVLMPEVFEAMGLRETVEELPTKQLDAFNGLLRMLSIPSFERTIEQATAADLSKARDQLRSLFPGNGADEFLLALVGIPTTLVAGPLLGGAFAAGLAQLGEETTQEE